MGFKIKKLSDLKHIKWPDYIVSLDGKTFGDFINTYPCSVVDFWAPWCAPCKVMNPRLRKLSKMYKGRVAFGRLNTEENPDIAKRYKIMSIPHLIIFSHGKKVAEMRGVKSVGDIKAVINKVLKRI